MDITLKYPAMSTLTDLDKAIKGAIEAAKTMKVRAQYAAIGCMILAAKEGKADDGTPFDEVAIQRANYLVEQLGAGVKGEGLVKFLVYKCGFKVNEAAKKEGFVDCAKPAWIREHLEAAKEVYWWTYAPATPFKGFNFQEEVARLLKRADNAVKLAEGDDAIAETVEIDRGMLEVVHALVGGTAVKTDVALRVMDRLTPQTEEKKEAA